MPRAKAKIFNYYSSPLFTKPTQKKLEMVRSKGRGFESPIKFPSKKQHMKNYCIDTDGNFIEVKDLVVVLENIGEFKRGELITITKCDEFNIIHSGFRKLLGFNVLKTN